MKQKHLFALAATLLIGALALSVFLYRKQSGDSNTFSSAQNQAALTRSDTPSFGEPTAPVHIVEFLDPACGTCGEFYPFVKKMMAANPGKIRVSVRYAPFHPGSDQVVKVLEAARMQGQFGQALEALFASQAVWVLNHRANVDLIWGPLSGLGLDMERLKTDMNSPEIAQRVQRDLEDANSLGVAMTPEFFVNGKPMPSFGYQQLTTLVDDALARAK
jgi:protein-disulfide isomerase